MPHMMASASGPVMGGMPPSAYLTQHRGQPTPYHQHQLLGANDPLHHHHLMMMSAGAAPSSALADDVVLPSSTLTHTNRTPLVP